jgi:putative FmdB family regulatory protein
MPIYDYQCQSCGETFDALRSMNDDDKEVQCPRCLDFNSQRVLSLTASDAKMLKSSCGGGSNRPMRFG